MNTKPELPKSIRNLFSTQQNWQNWLDIEAALALTQAELGMIPSEIAQEIAAKAKLNYLDLPALEQDIQKTMAPVLSVVHALAKVCSGNAGGYVHWGATTQNVIVAGRLLTMQKTHFFLMHRLANIVEILANMAEQSADYVVAGRTNRKHALPITFGFKVAGWLEELLRCIERFESLEHRTFSLIFGGAIGAMHAFGLQGDLLAQKLAKRLGMTSPKVHSRATVDGLVEYLVAIGLLSMTCERIGSELYTLMLDEIGEVSEGLDQSVVGSSTMPHKDNPKHVVAVIAYTTRLRAYVAPSLEAGIPSHEGDAASNQLIYSLIDEVCPLAYDMLSRFELLLAHLNLHPERMKQNLYRSADVIASENLMMVMAEKLGRQQSHDVVHEAIRLAKIKHQSVPEILYSEEAVQAHFSLETLRNALDPEQYTGNSSTVARQMASSALEKINHARANW